MTRDTAERVGWSRWLLVVLAVAAGLRVFLVLGGGQFYWPDENRYYVAGDAVDRLAARDWAGMCRLLLGAADHLLFKVLAMLPALAIHGFGYHSAIPGMFCAAFSVLDIYLTWRIALAAGAAPREAFLAGLFLAAANTNFYYARHLLPYDAALSFGLLALLAGWFGSGWRRSVACGVGAGLAFLTYNGYWLFGAVVLVGHVLWSGAPGWTPAARRAGLAAAGLLLPIGLVVAAAKGLAGADLVGQFRQFSHSINQGDFGGGWRLMLEYFWAAERMNLVLGLAGLVLAVAGAAAARRRHYGLKWVAGTILVVAGLLLLSDAWHKFVIYGRTARQLVPLVCLAGAFSLERLLRTGGAAARLATAAIVVLLAQAAANFDAPLRQWFPQRFGPVAAATIRKLQATGEKRLLTTLYLNRLLSPRDLVDELPDHDVMFARENPLQFEPYLYEGTPEAMRDLIRKHDTSMRVIAVNEARFNHPVNLQLPHPGVVQLTLRLPTDKTGVHEPLLVTGISGAGDLIYIIYDGPGSVRLGFDHWGSPGTESAPVPVDYAKPVKVILSTGALYADQAVAGAARPGVHHWLYAEVNGQVVWSRPAEFHVAMPASISFGSNYIGGSTCDAKFTGTILKVESLLMPPAMAPEPAGR